MRRLLLLGSLLCLSACHPQPEHAMPDVSAVRTRLAFSCAYEKDRLPPLNPEADQLFKYARWLEQNNLLQRQRSVSETAARYYRIAAAHGHYKANINLQNNYSHGDIDGDIEEMLDLNDALIKAGIPMAITSSATTWRTASATARTRNWRCACSAKPPIWAIRRRNTMLATG
jgi:TPR repeat protein